MLKNCLLATSALVAAFAVAAPAHADSGNLSLADRVRILEQELAKSKDYQQDMRTRLSTLEQSSKDVSWSFDNGRPKIKSGDGRFELAFRGRFHFDFASYQQEDNVAAATVLPGGAAYFRRSQIGVEGKAFNDFWYEMRYDFGGSNAEGSGSINIMRVAYHGIPNFRINIGAIQPQFTHEDSVSSNEITFMERPEATNLAVDAFGGGDARRGIELTFQKEDMFYAGDNLLITGAYTGDKIGTTHDGTAPSGDIADESQNVLGRIAYRLWSDGKSNIQIAADGASIIKHDDNQTIRLRERPELRGHDIRFADSGSIAFDDAYMYGGEFAANWKSLYVSGEYYQYTIDQRNSPNDPTFVAWYGQASYFLTGESKKYAASSKSNNAAAFGAPKIIKPFSPGAGSWGAVELAARISKVNMTDRENGFSTGGETLGLGAGINWYLNNNIRMMFNYINYDVNKGASSQTIDEMGARLQFAF